MDNGTHYRTCHPCEAMCGVAIEVAKGRIQSVKGDARDPFSHGHICPKAVALKDLHEDPDRLTQPMRRTADGWQEMEWGAAFELVAEQRHDIISSHGHNAAGVYLGNPVLSSHNGTRLEKAFAQLDFMVSVDYYLNETTRHADVILPPTHALQHSHYDLIFNMMAVRNTAKYSEALFPPPADSRHDWQILLELAHRLERRKNGGRLGIRQELGWQAFKKAGPDRFLDLALRSGPYGQPTGSLRRLLQPAVLLIQSIFPTKHPLHGLSRLSPANRHWQNLPKGLSLTNLRANPHGVDLGPLRPCMPERLFTQDGKIDLAPRRYLNDLGRLHERLAQPVSDDLFLIGRRHVRSNNSWMHNSPRLVKGRVRCTLMIHPDDATRFCLTDGAVASVKTKAGAIVLPVEITEDMMQGVVSVPHGWGHTRRGTSQQVAQAHAGASINDVIRDDQTDPLSGVSVLNGQAVSAVNTAHSRKRA